MSSPESLQPDAAKGRVLLADSDSSEQEALGDFFSREGWGHDVVTSAETLLQALCSRRYDVIVTSLQMPDLSGRDLLRKIRSSQPGQAVIVVADPNGMQHASSVLADGDALDFIERPIDLDILQGALERVSASLEMTSNTVQAECDMAPVCIDETVTSRELSQRKIKLDIAEKLVNAGKVDLHTSLRMDLAFQEAVANCLEHGNLELESEWREEIDADGNDRFSTLKKERLADPHYAERTVRIEIEYANGSLEIRVQDQGNGFLPPTDSSDQTGELRVHGRGLTIMNSVMDDVIYRDRGRQIILRKKIDSNGS